MKRKIQDQTIALHDGFYAIVDNKTFGPWPDKGAAKAGMKTEQRRAKVRKTRDRKKS